MPDDALAHYGLTVIGLRFRGRTFVPVRQRGYAGGWLRGILGWCLSREVCLYERVACERCAIRHDCAYPQCFKPAEIDKQAPLAPWVLHHWRVRSDERAVQFTVLLLGKGILFAETLLNALARHWPQQVEHAGELERVDDVASSQPLWVQGRFQGSHAPRALSLPCKSTTAARVLLQTPLASKHQDDGTDPLYKPLKTRLQRLIQQFGTGQPLVLPTLPWHCQNQDLTHVRIPLGSKQRCIQGWRGELHLAEITPVGQALLHLGELLHAGGSVSCGCGRYALVLKDD